MEKTRKTQDKSSFLKQRAQAFNYLKAERLEVDLPAKILFLIMDEFSSEPVIKERKKRKHYFCDHCQKNVSKATYYRHRTEFYDDLLKNWRPAKSCKQDYTICKLVNE